MSERNPECPEMTWVFSDRTWLRGNMSCTGYLGRYWRSAPSGMAYYTVNLSIRS